jgi:hypothetical protein
VPTIEVARSWVEAVKVASCGLKGCCMMLALAHLSANAVTTVNRWDEKTGLRRDAVGSQVIDALEAQEIKETGNEEG